MTDQPPRTKNGYDADEQAIIIIHYYMLAIQHEARVAATYVLLVLVLVLVLVPYLSNILYYVVLW